jgi:hypothetical protein
MPYSYRKLTAAVDYYHSAVSTTAAATAVATTPSLLPLLH